MKKVCIGILLISLICFSACSTSTVKPDDSVENSNLPVDNRGLGHQIVESDNFEIVETNNDSWMKVDLPEVGLKNLVVGKLEEGKVIESEQDTLPVYLFQDYRYDDSIYHDSYLAVRANSKLLVKDLSEESGSYSDVLYLGDIDGDSLDEIIVHEQKGKTGGVGQYFTRIFKVKDDKIEEFFTLRNFDTGFKSELKDGYKVKITNRFTKKGAVVRYRLEEGKGEKKLFDENGKVVGKGKISCDNFKEVTPKDVDGDGICELMCVQYVSIAGHSNYLGEATSVLKFNPKKQIFKVTDTEFVTIEQQ